MNPSDGGKLNIQLRNKRAATKRQHVEEHEINTLTDDEAKNMVEKLKTTVVNNQNMDAIKNMLQLTLKYRTQMLKNEQLNLREYFPYFFVSKELVSTIIYTLLELFNESVSIYRFCSNFLYVIRTCKRIHFSTNGTKYQHE